MGCSSYEDIVNNDPNKKADYLTETICESIKARKRAKIQEKYDKEKEEAERLEKEYLRQQYLLNSLNAKGPKSYVDNLITVEIPNMDFGILAPEEEIVKDLNDRDCEEYKEDEVDEEEEEINIEEIKKEEEKNKNEIDELKKKIEEMNKKEEEEKNIKTKKERKKGGGGAGFFGKKNQENQENQENEKEKDENEKNVEKEKEINEENEENEEKGIKEENKKQINEEEKKESINNEEENNEKRSREEKKDKDESKKEKSNNEEENLNENDKENDDKKGKRNKKKKKTKKEDKIEENEENINNENKDENEENKLKEKKTKKKKSKKKDKMKELMELKVESPPYVDQIKRYKYPKKNNNTENKLVFSSLPSELILCIIGDQKSGKTSFIRKYTKNEFEEAYQKTEKIENYDEIEAEIDEKKIKLVILDTPPLTIRKNIKIIQEEGINKSHIIIYIVDINDEHAEFKVRLLSQIFEFNEKHIIVIIGNKTDKISNYSTKNKEFIDDYCYIKKYIFNAISCANTTKDELENFVNETIINIL